MLQASIPSIMLAPYPTAQQGWSQPELDSQYEQAQAVVAAIRKLRSDYGLTRQRPTVYVACSSAARADVIQALSGDIACLSTSAEVLLLAADAPVPPYSSVAIVDDVVTVHMLLKVSGSACLQAVGCLRRRRAWRACVADWCTAQAAHMQHSWSWQATGGPARYCRALLNNSICFITLCLVVQ
jgi:valyl-tRNA synthetase